MKKYIPVALSFLLAACGGDSGSNDNEEQNKSNLFAVSESAESNDGFQSAQRVAANSLITGSGNTASDPIDYYSFEVLQGSTLSISLTCPSDLADIDLSLYHSNYGTVLYSIEDNCTEEMTYQVTEDMVMYISVDFLDGGPSSYNLTISTEYDTIIPAITVDDSGTPTITNPSNNIYESCSQLYVNGLNYYVDTNGPVVGTCPGDYDYQCRIENGKDVDPDFTTYSDIFFTEEFIESTWGNNFTFEDICKNDAADDYEGITHTPIIL